MRSSCRPSCHSGACSWSAQTAYTSSIGASMSTDAAPRIIPMRATLPHGGRGGGPSDLRAHELELAHAGRVTLDRVHELDVDRDATGAGRAEGAREGVAHLGAHVA